MKLSSTASNKSFFENKFPRARVVRSVIFPFFSVLYIGDGQIVRNIGQIVRIFVRNIGQIVRNFVRYLVCFWTSLKHPWNRFRSQIEHIKEGEGIWHKLAQINFVFFRERSF